MEQERTQDKPTMRALSGKAHHNTCMNVVNLAFVIAIIVVLAVESGDCESPVRAWLITYAVVSALLVGLYFIVNYYLVKQNAAGAMMCLGCLYLLLSLFMFAWIITGSVFVFDNTECADEAPAVWYLAMVLVVINYLFWALTLLVCIFACCGVAILMGQAADELNEELAHHETAEEEAKQGKYEQV